MAVAFEDFEVSFVDDPLDSLVRWCFVVWPKVGIPDLLVSARQIIRRVFAKLIWMIIW